MFLEKYNSSDGSAVWNDIMVNVEANNEAQIKGDIAIDSSGNIYIVWMDDRNGNWDIYVQKRDPNGAALWPADLKINGAGFSDRENPRIVIDDEDNFYVVWEDLSAGNKDIYWAKFDSDGSVLFAERKVNTDTSGLDQYEPAIAFDGNGYFYISWSDKRNSQPDIYAQKYDKSGNIATIGNWTTGDVKINDDSLPDAWRTNSSVAYSSTGAIYFSWEDTRNGTPDVYSAKFDSDGNKLWSYDLIMNGDLSGTQGNPEVVTDSSGYGITAWEDNKNGESNYDIYAARYIDLGFFTRTSIPITITGAKLRGNDTDGSPLYKYSQTFTSDALGEINNISVEWDNYVFAVGEGYTIISTDQPEPLAINPGNTKDIIINLEP